MLHLIRNLLRSLFRKNNKPIDETEEPIASIHFDMHDNEMISIKCYTPNLSTMTDEDIASFAESYAQLLANINDGMYNQSIVKIIKDNVDYDNYKEVLLFNNILSFWAIFHVENKKNISTNKLAPLIKPTQVFKRQ